MDPTDNAIEKSASIIWIDDGIVYVRSKGVVSTVESITEASSAIRELIGGAPRPLLFDARKWPSADPDAWATLIGNLRSTTTEMAILVDPEHPAEMGEYPAVMDQLLVPVRIFTDETKALAFLRDEQGHADCG